MSTVPAGPAGGEEPTTLEATPQDTGDVLISAIGLRRGEQYCMIYSTRRGDTIRHWADLPDQGAVELTLAEARALWMEARKQTPEGELT